MSRKLFREDAHTSKNLEQRARHQFEHEDCDDFLKINFNYLPLI